MDALALDQMLPEYEQNYQDALHSHSQPPSPVPPDPEEVEPDREVEVISGEVVSEETYEANIGGGETVPVGGTDEQVDSPSESSAAEGLLDYQGVMDKNSRNSSSSASSMIYNHSSSESSSFYNTSSMSPFINYDRDVPAQRLVALFGRQFDKPEEIASSFQKLVPNMSNSNTPAIKFVPFTLKRKSLLKGSFSSSELLKNDLICMCYNASEARILLTGRDGFYTSLLRHIETTLGKRGRSIAKPSGHPRAKLYRSFPMPSS